MADVSSRYLIIVSVGTPTPDHLQKMVPALQRELSRISLSEPVQAFRSAPADYFGYLIESRMAPQQIRATLETPGRPGHEPNPFLGGSDGVFVLEIGPNVSAGEGFTRALTWLQRHPAGK